MPDKDLTLYAKQTPVMSNYTVYHYKESVDGSYFGLTDEEVLSGLTESEVTPQPKQYEGFTSPEAKTEQVNGQGRTGYLVLLYAEQLQSDLCPEQWRR